MVIVAEFLLIVNLNGPLININFILAIFTSTIIHLVCTPKFCISTFVSYFRWGGTVIPKKVMQSLCIMGDVQMANGYFQISIVSILIFILCYNMLLKMCS